MNPAAPLVIVCSLLLLCEIAEPSPPESLKLVSVLYRHGDRSPVSIYPLDINQVANAWPDGLGWLTNVGKVQQYELGQYLKQRYDGFINTSYYHHDEIQVQSSGVERCLMSASSNLAGLYPPQDGQIWNPDILWQPIPVQTLPTTMDNKLAQGAPCPRYDQLVQEVLNSPAIQKEEQENKAFYDMVEKNTGVPKESIKDIWSVGDTLVCERAHNLTWNAWAQQPGVWEKMQQLNTLSFDLVTYNNEMAKLKGGPLLKEIIANMQNAATQTLPKFYMYSAHDTTVAALLSALHVFDRHAPTYRALVMVELHQIQDVYGVKIFYRNDTTRDPYELVVPGCQSPCKLDDLITLTKDTVPVDWDAECKAQTSVAASGALTPASWIALSVGICICVIIAVALVVMVIRLKRRQAGVYSKL
ncbi:lysosomal acid phosphatase-like [Physella acuta]|uniref:lysosomal acid phosphatase-like n=1 Tax=Physella acuta TaxID=109671 RepID=UPI0027DBD4FB|nr:lysosomal acid phosphatase-like [Physella acuta]XP_059149852.1 lysosomal acid phosphatase-like [Physella acuta]XP_059149853.1 lysosomal acid phosphatase-like [Physella acuta]